MAEIGEPIALGARPSVSLPSVRDLVQSLVIGVASAVAVVSVGWWGLPIVFGLVLVWGWVERRTGRAPQREPGDTLARRLPGALLFAGALGAVFVAANWLFDASAAFFASFGTIFAFWVVCCVILPRRNAHAPKAPVLAARPTGIHGTEIVGPRSRRPRRSATRRDERFASAVV